MSAAFVSQLRARPGVIRVGADGSPRITIRVQMPEVWDAVRVETPASEPVRSVKAEALAVLQPQGDLSEDFVVKLNGYEVLDEMASLADVGAMDGSTFLLTYRRRRPVR